MFYTYALQSVVDNNFYVGFTKDLKLRIEKHQKGRVPSTRSRRPLKLIYYEACLNQKKKGGQANYTSSNSPWCPQPISQG